MKKICVLLAAYNGEKYLKEQLDSILSQVDVVIDVYISLDLSTDSSLDIINEYEKNHDNIYILEYGLRYGSAGQNFFRLLTDVDFSDYCYVSFADQDDIWLPNKLHHAVEMINLHNCDAVSSNVLAFWEDGREKLIKKDYPQVDYDYVFESSGPGCSFLLTRKLSLDIKKSLLDKKDEINKLWLHDWYCYSFSRGNNFKWYIDNKALMLYRQHSSNEVGANNGLSSIIRRLKVILSGDAFNKVLVQANFIGLNNKPIKLLKENTSFSLFKLSMMANKCRRSSSEKFAFFIIIIILAVKRLFNVK
ncbi:glycosyltransferase [Photobacterium andalusiense]|uniref:Putative glycosyl transferase n=1 Tax=Photobacterium andalusiense TaxID=2204296 RepID=A0A1Y6MHN0_9GAMM|nr:glycosyltransferase [Photobacterium andalusiense]SMY35952.1 putative glycosyl transferase [Photobacterium andalusiense]